MTGLHPAVVQLDGSTDRPATGDPLLAGGRAVGRLGTVVDHVDDGPIAADAGRTVSQLVLNWTIHRPGITVALCGAKRSNQLRENAGAMGWSLTSDHLARIDAAVARRGKPATRTAV